MKIDRKKVVENLRKIREELSPLTAAQISVAIELIEQDEPVKPKEQEAVEPKTTITSNGFKYDFCGDCGRLLPVAQDFEKAYFCPHCGRSVKRND